MYLWYMMCTDNVGGSRWPSCEHYGVIGKKDCLLTGDDVWADDAWGALCANTGWCMRGRWQWPPQTSLIEGCHSWTAVHALDGRRYMCVCVYRSETRQVALCIALAKYCGHTQCGCTGGQLNGLSHLHLLPPLPIRCFLLNGLVSISLSNPFPSLSYRYTTTRDDAAR